MDVLRIFVTITNKRRMLKSDHLFILEFVAREREDRRYTMLLWEAKQNAKSKLWFVEE